jgi:nicotinamidase-related amidase
MLQRKANIMKTSTPSFYNPANAASWAYNPNVRSLFEAAGDYRKQNEIKAAASDQKRVALLLIDVQRDFCHTEGTLYVGGRSGMGAIEDSKRIAEFVYRNMDRITSVIPTMDTHQAIQIFSPSFWTDQDRQPLSPHLLIDGNMKVLTPDGKPTGQRAVVNPAITHQVTGADNYVWLEKQAAFYTAELARKGKYLLYLWPEHCMLGSIGYSLVGVVQEAHMFHSYVRSAQNEPQIKGGNPLTENYSIFGPEVTKRHDGKGDFVQKNMAFLRTLLDNDEIVIAGQASSHCVKSSIDDLLDEILAKDPALAKKVTLLRDCTSAVVVPGVVDYTDQAEQAFDRYAAAGMKIVSSTDPIDSWMK